MKYKLMIVDDSIQEREAQYRKVFPSSQFDLVIVDSPLHLADIIKETPVDAYVVDVFLNQGNWAPIGDAGGLFSQILCNVPRPTPVFLVSQKWGNKNVIPILNSVNRHRDIDVLRYLAWPEFQRAAKDKRNNIDLTVLQDKILDDLSIWHERSTFRPSDDQNIRLLLLADLQYGDSHTSDLAVFDENWIVQTLKRDNLLPDFVVIAGDVAFSGAPREFDLAKSKLDENLFQYMWGTRQAEAMRDRIIVVPGNHDVNLRLAACNQYDWDRDKKRWMAKDSSMANDHAGKDLEVDRSRNYALEPFRQFAHALTGSRAWESHFNSSRVDRRFEHIGIRFYLLNSVSQASIDAPNGAEFSADALGKITRSLGCNDKPDDFFNIAVSHHGIQIGNPKSIQMNDWESVGKQFFKMHKVGLWMFGHYHKGDFNPIEDSRLGLLQAPTLKIRPAEDVRRGFTLVELIRENGKVIGIDIFFYGLGEKGVTEKERPVPRHLDVTSN